MYYFASMGLFQHHRLCDCLYHLSILLCCCFVVEVVCIGSSFPLLLCLCCMMCHPLNKDMDIDFVFEGSDLNETGGPKDHASQV